MPTHQKIVIAIADSPSVFYGALAQLIGKHLSTNLMTRAWLLILLLIPATLTYGRSDTLTVAEKLAIDVAHRNSCFGQFMLADSCSRVGDSVAAGHYLMHVNPYYLFAEEQTPETIDSYLAHTFLLPTNVRKRYVDSFNRIYRKPRTPAYLAFERMYHEDQKMRYIDTITNRDSALALCKRWNYTDSLHFALLLKYIHQYGWPTIENGSLYASIIAVHDHYHHKEYFGFIKRAELRGRCSKNILDLILIWLHDDVSLQADLSKYKHKKIDVTSLLENKMPDSLETIESFVKAHCPVQWRFAEEAGRKRNQDQDWVDFELNRVSQSIVQMKKHIINSNMVCDEGLADYRQRRDLRILDLWTIHSKLVDGDSLKLFLYLLYGDEIKYDDLGVLFGDSAFATHAIYFDYNSTIIQDESYLFLAKLKQWLNAKPTLKLEVSGHTDDVGNQRDNLSLSKARAEAVRNYLIKEGMAADRIVAKGYGSQRPIVPNKTEDDRSINRRVEFKKLSK